MKKILIASVSANNVIGFNGNIPWNNKLDLAHFKNTTVKNSLLMGRKTFDSIGRVLQDRVNIVLTRNIPTVQPGMPNLIYEQDITVAIDNAERRGYGNLYIIGGGEIFKQTIELGDGLIITHFPFVSEGDTFFPEIDSAIWKEYKEVKYPEFHVSHYLKRN